MKPQTRPRGHLPRPDHRIHARALEGGKRQRPRAPCQVADSAGHSVAVLPRIYAWKSRRPRGTLELGRVLGTASRADYTYCMAASLKPSKKGEDSSHAERDSREEHGDVELRSPTSVVRQVVTWLCLVSAPVLAAMTFFPIARATLEQQQWVITIFRQHYAAIFGLPGAALLSFILVVVFEARFDNIEMQIANLVKFRGASGPIVLWVLCFLSISLAIRLLW